MPIKHDSAGRLLNRIPSNGMRTDYSYDEMNRRTAVIDATGTRTTTAYTLRGDTVAITNANSETVKFEIDRPTKITDAQNGKTAFTYDLAGNRLTVKDAELKTHSFAYDDLGRLTAETDHSGKTTTYKPDEAGNVFEKTNRLNETTRIIFDAANRPMWVDYLKDGTAETFGYDPAGNRASAANGTVGYTFQYDRLNRLTMLGNPDYLQVDYQYDPAGRLLSRVTSAGARTTSQYDANGALTRLSQYDAANALISDTSYTRDRVGNILTQADATGTTTYAYDPLYRLKTADYPGAASDALYSYDKVGNRQTT